MTKYYRVRSQEQWDWLKNKLEIEDDLHVSNFPVTILYGDVFCGIYKYHDDPEPLIEVSQMMEEEKMEDYVTIKGEDVEKLKNEQGDSLFFMSDKQHFAYSFIEGFDCSEVNIPKSLLYQKVRMSVAEKEELDKLKNEMSAHIYDLDDLLTRTKDSEDYPLLYHRLYVADGDGVERQLEFARAWADPSLIEVIPDKKWNVRVPISCNDAYYNKVINDCKDAVMVKHYVDKRSLQIDNNFKFTAEEIKYYHLDNDLFEKVEVTDDGTK